MEESAEVRDGYLRFCERLSAGDVESFDDIVSAEAKLIVGTAPGELVTERAQMRFGFETEGVRLQPGDPTGYAEGDLGWLFDEPEFFFPDDSSIHPRVTVVMRRENGTWRVVHAHFSIGVPDEEAAELDARARGG